MEASPWSPHREYKTPHPHLSAILEVWLNNKHFLILWLYGLFLDSLYTITILYNNGSIFCILYTGHSLDQSLCSLITP